MPTPKLLIATDDEWVIQCPGCGVYGDIDEDQLYGRISIDCPDCEYHETHDLSDQLEG